MAEWPRPCPRSPCVRTRRPQSLSFFREPALAVEAMEAELPPVEERRRLREELSEFVESCRRTLEEVTASLGWSLDRLEPGEEAAAAEVRGPRGRRRRAGRGVCRAKMGSARDSGAVASRSLAPLPGKPRNRGGPAVR